MNSIASGTLPSSTNVKANDVSLHIRDPVRGKMRRNGSRAPSPSVAEPRRPLLLGVYSFVRAARVCPGVQRISLLGSLVTGKAIPRDVDLLVVIDRRWI